MIDLAMSWPVLANDSAVPQSRRGERRPRIAENIRPHVRHNSVAPAGALECEEVPMHGRGQPFTCALSLILSRIAFARGPQGDGQADEPVERECLSGDQHHGGGHAEYGGPRRSCAQSDNQCAGARRGVRTGAADQAIASARQRQ